MASSAVIKHDVGYLSTLPLGSIIAWHRDFSKTHVAALPPGWAECNGQVLDDPESPYHEHVIPNLNGHTETEEGGLFLRGRPESGIVQEDQLQSHTHADEGHHHTRSELGRPERVIHYDDDVGQGHAPTGGDGNSNRVGTITGTASARLGDPAASTAGAPRHGAETRPVNMSVVWIMKVKQVTAVRAVPAIEAHDQAPQGTVYIGADGNVEAAGRVKAAGFEGDGSALTDVPCTCYRELATGPFSEPGIIKSIDVHQFLGFITVVAHGGGGAYSSIHHYLVAGQGNGPEAPAQVGEIGPGFVGHFDEPVRVDVILEPESSRRDTVNVVAREASSGGGMSYRVVARKV